MSDLKRRCVAAVLMLLAVAVVLFCLPAWAFGISLLALFTLAYQEWCQMLGEKDSHHHLQVAFYGLGVGLLISAWNSPMMAVFLVALGALLWVLLAFSMLPALGPRGQSAVLPLTFDGLMGLWLLLPLLASLLLLYRMGPGVLCWMMALVWISDSLAYLGGRFCGRTPLAPTVSPKKTLEGVAVGLLFTLLFALTTAHSVLGPVSLPLGLMVVAVVFFGILGDLFESAIKRALSVKDSGSLIPGHGGILDRIDALTWGMPIGTVALYLIKGLAS